MFRWGVLSTQKQGIFLDLKTITKYLSRSLSSEKRHEIIENGKPHPEFSTLGKRSNDFSGFTNIPPKNRYDELYSISTPYHTHQHFSMPRNAILDYLSKITKKIAEKDYSVAQHLTTACFNRITEYQRSKNFQDRRNQFKLRIYQTNVLLIWCDEQNSNETSVRIVVLTYPNFHMCRQSKFSKDFIEPELIQKVDQEFANDRSTNYRRYELQRKKGKVNEDRQKIEDNWMLYLQNNDILVWNFDILKDGNETVQNIAVVKLENCVDQEEHVEWKKYLDLTTDSIFNFHFVLFCETTPFYLQPFHHLYYRLGTKFRGPLSKFLWTK